MEGFVEGSCGYGAIDMQAGAARKYEINMHRVQPFGVLGAAALLIAFAGQACAAASVGSSISVNSIEPTMLASVFLPSAWVRPRLAASAVDSVVFGPGEKLIAVASIKRAVSSVGLMVQGLRRAGLPAPGNSM